MTPEQESQWREEFEKVINYRGSIRFCNGVYADNRLQQKWIGFQVAKRRDQKELDKLTKEIGRIHEDRTMLVKELDILNNKITNLERNRMFWVDEVIRLKEKKL